MAEEEVVAAGVASPAPLDHKRKLEDLEPEAPEPTEPNGDDTADLNADPDSSEKAVLLEFDESEAKRARLDDKPDGIVIENGHQEEKVVDDSKLPVVETQDGSDELETVNIEQPIATDDERGEIQSIDNSEVEKSQKIEYEETQQLSTEVTHKGDKSQELANEETQQLSGEATQEGDKSQEPANEETQQLSAEAAQQGDISSTDQEQPSSGTHSLTRKMEVPNNKVGVLIGKAGDTIRYLQYNSGAKIQIKRDAESDPYSTTRPVEIIGSLENINKAEKLINAVIAEADAGGSPSLVARGLAPSQVAAVTEQIQIQVPNEKVGLIIGRGGETIKSLQTRSGARIQLIPQNVPEGDECKERTVRVTGDKRQIEIAKEMIKEVMNQTVRPSHLSSGFNQQAHRPRGSGGPTQWGPRGPHHSQPTAYDYPQRGPYPSHNPQYQHHQGYGNYPQQMGPRSNYNAGWEPRHPPSMQGQPPPHGGYDYYGGRRPSPTPAMGPSQPNYNYAQQQGPDYGHHPAQYSQAAPQHNYGHGYDEQKYENHAPPQNPYGGHGGPQPVYPQAGVHPGYAGQQQYEKPPTYGMPSQGPPQSYGAPRASQPGEMPYQGSTPAQSYGPNVPPQQTYPPYASSGPTQQQMYPSYGSASTADGYNQPPPASSTGYPQGGQPSYGQPVAQQVPGYTQVGTTGGYGQYPSSQLGYLEQSAPNASGYGAYQGTQDPAAYGSGPASAYSAPQATAQTVGYSQQTPAQQPGYDQSNAQSGGYGSVPAAAAPVSYGKTVSPQPGYAQYDSTQMYGAPR